MARAKLCSMGTWPRSSNLMDDTLPGSQLAWTGKAGSMQAGVYYTEWKNPRPKTKISHVDFVGTGKNVAVLIAITGFKGSRE